MQVNRISNNSNVQPWHYITTQIAYNNIDVNNGQYYHLRLDGLSQAQLRNLSLWWDGEYIGGLEQYQNFLLRANSDSIRLTIQTEDERILPLLSHISVKQSDIADIPFPQSVIGDENHIHHGWQAIENDEDNNRQNSNETIIDLEQLAYAPLARIGAAEPQVSARAEQIEQPQINHIYQNINSAAGDNFLLKFSYKSSGSQNVEIWWDGEKLSNLSSDINHYRFMVKASDNGSSTRLEFRNIADYFDRDIANISLVQVDEYESMPTPELVGGDDVIEGKENKAVRIEFDQLLANDGDDTSISDMRLNDDEEGNLEIFFDEGFAIYTPNQDFIGNINMTYTIINKAQTQKLDVSVTLNIVNVNDAPVLVKQIDDIAINENADFNIDLNDGFFKDKDGDQLRYHLTMKDGTPLPYWLTFDAGDLKLSGTTRFHMRGEYEFKLTASDPDGASADAFFTMNVNHDDDMGLIDVSKLNGISGFRLSGSDGRVAGWAGWKVSDAGDMNGDGYDDFIVGAPYANPNERVYAGTAYVVFGQENREDTHIDLQSLNGRDGFAIYGENTGDMLSNAISKAGDINGDGYDDIILGAPRADPQGSINAGAGYLIFGQASDADGRDNINLDNLQVNDGFRLQGGQYQSRLGFAVSGAGDVNGDGIADFIVASPRIDGDAGADAGKSYIIYGQAGALGDIFRERIFDLESIEKNEGFAIKGGGYYDLSGWSVADAGDFNGDGIGDILVNGVNATSPNGVNAAGKAYVIYGKKGGYDHDISLAHITSDIGFQINGSIRYDYIGYSLDGIGDINGDGYDDIALGRVNSNPNGVIVAGSAKIILGRSERIHEAISIEANASGQHDIAGMISVNGQIRGGNIGYSISDAGDFNADGYADFIISSPYVSTEDHQRAGTAYLVFGREFNDNDEINLEELNGHTGIKIPAIMARQQLGHDVSGAGDINGDGFDDIIIGAPYSTTDESAHAGSAYVIYGFDNRLQGTYHGSADKDILLGGSGNDALHGLGGRDIINAGAGDDLITISDTLFTQIDGGHGHDILTLHGSDMTLNLQQAHAHKIISVEQINLNNGNNLILSFDDIYNISDTRDNGKAKLIVDGDKDSIVALNRGDEWLKSDNALQQNNKSYDVYNKDNAMLLVESDIHIEYYDLG